MSSMLDSEKLLAYLASVAAQSSSSEVAAVLLADHEQMLLCSVAGHNLAADSLASLTVLMDEEHLYGRIIVTGEEVVIRNSDDHLPSNISVLMERHRLRAMLVIPITSEVEVLGALVIGTRRRGYGRSLVRVVRALADLAAVSMEKIKLLSDLERELQDMKWLTTITDKIHLEQGYDEVTKAVLVAGMEVLDPDAMAVYLPNDDVTSLTCVAASGMPVSTVAGTGADQQAALLDALQSRDPLVVSDLRKLSRDDPFATLILDVNVRSVLGLQLRHKGTPIGLLLAFYRQPNAVGPRCLELSKMLVLEAAVALNYSRLLEQSNSLVRELEEANARLAKQATQDGLTGLANHRAFHQRLSEQLHRVGRYGEIFSLAMIDVDHFKAYNDAYGHQEGDLALQAIARIISNSLRESDFAARYGGEEFTIVLPQTPKVHTRVAMDRIRKAIDTFSFPNGKLTISVGVAECPIDGVISNEVLEKADRALYHAKLTGRNRVCVWAAPVEQQTPRTEFGPDTPMVSVLVVEMDHDARRAVEGALLQAGYDLHRANSTQEAMELLRSRKFDIMLSDAIVLGTEGLEVLGLASSIHPTMPIVLTTVPSMAGAAREAMRHGVTDLLMKPFNEHELPVVLERNIERKRLERQMLLQKSTDILLQAIDALVAAIDAKDRLTAGHTARVTHLSLAMSDALALASEERYTLELAARLHDIGKLSLPDSALNKNGALTDEEWASMRRHPAVGSQIVGAIEELTYVATIVRHHHERLDGKGYPDGLQGEAIPLLSRIIAVADAFEAMTSDRAYRARMTPEEAVEELRRCVGTHYSSEVVEALVVSLHTGALDDDALDAAA